MKLTALESFSQSLAKASTLSYAAGTADFDGKFCDCFVLTWKTCPTHSPTTFDTSAVNNFAKDAVDEINENSNLEQAKLAISQAKSNLDLIVKYLEAGSV